MFESLREAIARYQAPPHLLTTGADGRPHAVATTLSWDGDRLLLAAGGRSLANADAHPGVTLLWSASRPGEYSLLLDGEASPAAGDPARLAVRPTRAVLHRPHTPHGPRNPDCGSDCVTLYG